MGAELDIFFPRGWLEPWWGWRGGLQSYRLLTNHAIFYIFFALFVTCLVHNVAATISYDWKELLVIRTVITHLKFFFHEPDGREILQTPDQAQIPVILWRRKLRFCGKRCLVRIRRRVANLPLPSILLANVWSLENKWDKLKACISYQRDINCNILCFTESWLNDDIKNIQLGYTLSAGQNRSLW
jgi:hypothetical protein